MPPLEVNISTSGYTEVGQSFNMTCSVRVVEGLVQQPNVTWMKMDDVSLYINIKNNITTIDDVAVKGQYDSNDNNNKADKNLWISPVSKFHKICRPVFNLVSNYYDPSLT